MNTRILVVDDSKATRRVLSALVNSRWTVCEEPRTEGRALVSRFRELKPDLVLLDLAMPEIDSIKAARQMHAVNPCVPSSCLR
jgi:two-component system chemotaxis response regulator CheY